MVDLMWVFSLLLAVVLGGVILLWVLHSSSGWQIRSNSGAKLPKGSFGWPIVGESLAFAKNPPKYASSRVQRYGSVFKSSLNLQPAILGTTSDFAKLVVGNTSIFASGWPENVSKIVGPRSFVFKDGAAHMSVKKILQKPLLPEILRSRVAPLESIILENLESWANRGTVTAKYETQKITLDTGLFSILGLKNVGNTQEGKTGLKHLQTMNVALFSPPVNLPGTAFNKGLKAKAALTVYFKSLLEKRKNEPNDENDVLGVLLAAQNDPKAREEVKELDDDTIIDNLVLMWFGSYDTTSTSLMWILKFLLDHPDAFRLVQAEQQQIRREKDPSGGPALNWEDIRKMVYTGKFFQEVQRHLSISPIITRKATETIEYKGYIIPKGWTVAPMFNRLHIDPDNFTDPSSFNPSRFDHAPKPYTYMPFSAGAHMCPGLELAKLISLIFIHHVTTTFTYESAAPYTGMVYDSFPSPIGGYPINIRRTANN